MNHNYQHRPLVVFPGALESALAGVQSCVLAGALLAAPLAFGQTQGAGAMFEGRPAMAGAQGGQGAQAGMPQGGLGVQGSEGQKGLVLRKPSGLDSMPPLPARAPGASAGAAANTSNTDMALKPGQGLASERRSALSKDRRDARKAARRARAAAARAAASAPAKSAP